MEGPRPAPLPQAPGEVWGGPWPLVGLLVRSLGGGTGKGRASPVTCLPSPTPFHLILPSSAGPALLGPRVWDHAARLRGVSKESEITRKGPGGGVCWTAGARVQGAPRGRPQLNCVDSSPLQPPDRRAPELREGLTYPPSLTEPLPMPGGTHPRHPPREPLGDAGRHSATAHSSQRRGFLA